jgi:hypothetical protein
MQRVSGSSRSFTTATERSSREAQRIRRLYLRKGEEIWSATETSATIRQAGEQVTLNWLIPLAAFTPGPFMLQVEVRDRVSGQTISREAEFQIKAQSKP